MMNRVVPQIAVVIVFEFSTSFSRAQPLPTAVLVLPVRAPAFEEIERGLRAQTSGRVQLKVLLATDYADKPQGLIQATLAQEPACVLPLGTVLSKKFLNYGDPDALPPLVATAISNPADVLEPEDLGTPRSRRIVVVKDGPDSIYSGTADLISVILPEAKLIGAPYNPNEPNSVSNLNKIKEEGKRHGWRLIVEEVQSPDGVQAAALSLLSQEPAAIWLGKDSIFTRSPDRLIELAHEKGVPTFCSDAGTVKGKHAVGTRSVAFEDLGHHVGRIVLEIIGGADVRSMPTSTVEDTQVFLSRTALSKLDLAVPDDIMRTAVLVGDAAPRSRPAPTNWPVIIIVALLFGVAAVVVWRRSSAR